MTGGGFGGCTVNLVKAGTEEQFAEELGRLYSAKYGIDAPRLRLQAGQWSRTVSRRGRLNPERKPERLSDALDILAPSRVLVLAVQVLQHERSIHRQ